MADVLILAAHPDDGDFGMGGTMLKLAKRYSVAHVILTRGESGTFGTPQERELEARNAGKHAGVEVEFLDFLDNHIEDTVENAQAIASVIRKHKPTIVFAPYHTNNAAHTDPRAHPDHLALGRIATKACRFAKFKNAPVKGEPHTVQTLLYYILPMYTQPSVVFDVSDVVPALEALWQCYPTQLQTMGGKISEILLLERKRTGFANKLPYAEGFIVDRPLKADAEMMMKL